ncbi:MAG: coenzyme F420-0:L-glutamate ligase [Acidimicrobiales bacterium]|nr:coenzyme F420-0:L-glutamate ligase [Acidimicrobiales bacterium]
MSDVVGELRILPVRGIGEIVPGSDLAEIISHACSADPGTTLVDGDVLVVTQKIVSKAEDRIEAIDFDDPKLHKTIVERESTRIVRRRGDLIISETSHGWICANAGVDLSNIEAGYAALLPVDSDRSARRIRDALRHRFGVDVAVIVSDTFGRPWRRGLTDVAIGCAGIRPIADLRGSNDSLGRELQVTEVCIVDELAAAADLVCGKAANIPVAICRGVDASWLGEGSAQRELVRHPSEDLFR